MYEHGFSTEEYRRFIDDESNQATIRLWQSEIEQCLSLLKNWADTHAIEIFDERRQLVSLGNLIGTFLCTP